MNDNESDKCFRLAESFHRHNPPIRYVVNMKTMTVSPFKIATTPDEFDKILNQDEKAFELEKEAYRHLMSVIATKRPELDLAQARANRTCEEISNELDKVNKAYSEAVDVLSKLEE